MFKRLIHRAALKAERVADQLFSRTGKGRVIDPYIGYATPDQIILRGRVLSKLRHSSAVEGQTRLTNLRQMLGMFLTDEVRDVTVRCGDAEALTDEEGYFTLLLPRDARTGRHSEQVYIEEGQVPTLCPFLVPAVDARFMVISDIDDTMLETGAYSLMRNLFTSFTGNSLTRLVFPDAVDLMNALSEGGRNPIYYVSSSPWNLHDFLADIFENTRLVRGPMFLRDLGLSDTKFITDGHGSHKGASIDHILRANPDLPTILLGDTGQHDARIYRDVIERHNDRIIAVGLRTPGAGIDAQDKRDLDAIAATGVAHFAGPDFTELAKNLAEEHPDLFPCSSNENRD
ncbi:phosphatase domain-containing protein [Roseovarius sp. Pro17]|uniref:phosphatase domain-containing protein n=1 Tax=Roseovarius sp. Pro17 TaxID=3108175 RepID=UPI002D79BCD6|nr:phosphatase domain-containing protein [Roseovarius sp. Pro17]